MKPSALVAFALLLLSSPLVITQSAPPELKPKDWFVRLLPAQSSFPKSATEQQVEQMKRHAAYWKGQLAAGHLILGGPVLDPSGVYGILVIEANSETEAQAIVAADPVVQSGLMHVQMAPMRVSFLKGAL